MCDLYSPAIISFFFIFLQEPDEQEAPDDQDSSPPEDTSLYPHSPGTTQFQQVVSPSPAPHSWWTDLLLGLSSLS